jgi:heptosyltransferase-3
VASVLDSLPRDSRIAVLRLRSLGDCVLTTPALELLHSCRPDLRIGVAVEDRFREIFVGLPSVHEILQPELAAVRAWRPALCLNFHGGTRSAWMTALSGARWRAGFAHYRHQFVYNLKIPRAQQILGLDRKVHTAEHLASAVFHLGVPESEIPRASLALPADVPRRPGVQPCQAVIHAVAANPDKTWPAERFLAVARYLTGAGFEPVFIGGAGDDLAPFTSYRTLIGAPLSEIKALLGRSSLFVGNDSGPAHMAAAFGLPVVVIFGPSDPAIWGPWHTAGEVVQDPAGIAAIPVARVIEALDRVRVHA